MADDTIEHVDLAHYSAALDEIYQLRSALAYEAGVTAAHLTLASFPKSRRAFAEEQVARMRAAARGETGEAYADVPDRSRRSALADAGALELLTRGQWEQRASGHVCRNCEGVDPGSCPFNPKGTNRG